MNLQIVKATKKRENIIADRDHERRVADLSSKIAVRLSLPDVDVNDIYIAAQNHDRGKSYALNDVLNKPGSLSDSEYELIKYHVVYSALEAIEKDYNANIIKYIYYHHESYDGSGYPCGLRGNNIPIGARIIRVADFYDALTSARVYRQKHKKDDAIQIMSENRHLLDPYVFKTLTMILRDYDDQVAEMQEVRRVPVLERRML